MARAAERAGRKGGVVQDKLFLPGLKKLRKLYEAEFFGRVLSVRLDFGWWVFDGELTAAQRPSWNYRKATGGGADPRYVRALALHLRPPLGADHRGVMPAHDGAAAAHRRGRAALRRRCRGPRLRDLRTRRRRAWRRSRSSWASRVKRDDLLQIQVDGTLGSAVAGLHRCFIQPAVATPRPFFSPEVPQAMDFDAQWQEMPEIEPFENGYRAGWELFLRHVAEDAPFPAPLIEGAKSVQLAEACYQSHRERRWVDLPPLGLLPCRVACVTRQCLGAPRLYSATHLPALPIRQGHRFGVPH